MKFDPDIHHRRSIRLRGYDYARAGAYFVTVCVQGRECLFGEVVAGKIVLTPEGEMVRSVWRGLAERFPNLVLDEFVAMPNHCHGILMISEPVGAPLAAPCPGHPVKPKGAASSAPTLGGIVRAFKSISAIAVNRLMDRADRPLWQRNYYERILRDDEELDRARRYIADNPAKWAMDAENPANGL